MQGQAGPQYVDRGVVVTASGRRPTHLLDEGQLTVGRRAERPQVPRLDPVGRELAGRPGHRQVVLVEVAVTVGAQQAVGQQPGERGLVDAGGATHLALGEPLEGGRGLDPALGVDRLTSGMLRFADGQATFTQSVALASGDVPFGASAAPVR